jgi:hypothetical protein
LKARFFYSKKIKMDNDPQSLNNVPGWERQALEKLAFAALEEQKKQFFVLIALVVNPVIPVVCDNGKLRIPGPLILL